MKLDEILTTPCEPNWRNKPTDGYREARMAAIKCKDGAKISVQASEFHYCTPRTNEGPWTEVECGYPTVAPTGKLLEYAEDPQRPTDTVYGYVPVGVVREYIEAHGGEAK